MSAQEEEIPIMKSKNVNFLIELLAKERDYVNSIIARDAMAGLNQPSVLDGRRRRLKKIEAAMDEMQEIRREIRKDFRQ